MKPTDDDLLKDYLNAVDSLTINGEYLLQKQVEVLKHKTKDNEYIIKGKLLDSESEIQNLKEQIRLMQASQKEILESLRYPEKLAQINTENIT